MPADAAYAAVFLRVHPTGKAILSLSFDSDGNDMQYAQAVTNELGIEVEDIDVVPADTDRFGEDHGFSNRAGSNAAEQVAVAARKIREKARLIAAGALGASPDSLRWGENRWYSGSDPSRGRTIQEIALLAHAGGVLPPGVEGGLDGQATYRV